NNRVAVRINDNYEAMHDKFMVFDRRAVLTGSFNFSASADSRNAVSVMPIFSRSVFTVSGCGTTLTILIITLLPEV
ncbi:phospholipase D-like domain-containing protein, partial [Morganella morganii]